MQHWCQKLDFSMGFGIEMTRKRNERKSRSDDGETEETASPDDNLGNKLLWFAFLADKRNCEHSNQQGKQN